MSEPLLPQPPSPTGEPILPQWAVRLLAILSTAAGAAAPFMSEGPYKDGALFIMALGVGFGIVSQGVRR